MSRAWVVPSMRCSCYAASSVLPCRIFLHLRSELNYHQLFEAEIERFSLDTLSERQGAALAAVGLPDPA